MRNEIYSASSIYSGAVTLVKITCPVCKEKLHVSSQTVYHRGEKRFCSYGCMRKWDKDHEKKQRQTQFVYDKINVRKRLYECERKLEKCQEALKSGSTSSRRNMVKYWTTKIAEQKQILKEMEEIRDEG